MILRGSRGSLVMGRGSWVPDAWKSRAARDDCVGQGSRVDKGKRSSQGKVAAGSRVAVVGL
jgi:hypothetical protein